MVFVCLRRKRGKMGEEEEGREKEMKLACL